jgi:hypothetical protein
MKLQDYIKYYIGCNVITTDDNERAELVGVSDDNAHLVHEGTGNYGTCDVTGVKLVLRRLEDMTEEEAITIATMAMFDKPAGYPIKDYTVRRLPLGNYPPSACQVAINNDWYEMEIAIGFNTGNIWFTKFEQRVFNQPAIFHYLLTQHFDLFGLIDAGLAVDQKTITQ